MLYITQWIVAAFIGVPGLTQGDERHEHQLRATANKHR